jgi:hypothetical protein
MLCENAWTSFKSLKIIKKIVKKIEKHFTSLNSPSTSYLHAGDFSTDFHN